MKKNGFTLAEVLITLAIIGVVATMTLPALMTNTNEQQYKTGLKKGINTLTEAAQMNAAMDGYDYSGINQTPATLDEIDPEQPSLLRLISDRTAIDSNPDNVGTSKQYSNGALSSNFTVFFRDGSSLMFPNDSKITVAGNADLNKPANDGLPIGVAVVYDVNGKKQPNIVSNCVEEFNGLTGSDAAGNCADKNKRVIKDQFGVKLRGKFAVPNGAAARWAYDS